MDYNINAGIRGLIFDLDGTLADTMPYHWQAWKRACKKYGADIEPALLKKHTGSPGHIIAGEVISKFGLEGSVTVKEIVQEKIQQFHKLQHLVKPIEPVADIVRKYHGILPMAIGTGGHIESVERTLKITGLRKYFDIIVTANDVDNFKPHPETFLKCAEIMNIDPPHIQVFEDGDYGIEAARKAGMIPIDVRSWYESDW